MIKPMLTVKRELWKFAPPDKTKPKAPRQLVPSAVPAFDLGTYISLYNPYPAIRPPKGTWDSEPPPHVLVGGPKTEKEDALYMLLPTESETNQKLTWQFKNNDHFVARAVRVAYVYYKVSDSDPSIAVLTKDYVLFGFEGGIAYGQSI